MGLLKVFYESDHRVGQILDVFFPELKPAPAAPKRTEGEQLMYEKCGYIDDQITSIIDRALDARDAQHKRELEGLRDRCAAAAKDWYLGSRVSFTELADLILETPLAEAKR